MADGILDHEHQTQWPRERMKMVYTFPTNQKLWDGYAEIRATELYREHRQEVDTGAEVAWPERPNEDELSGLQHAGLHELQCRSKRAVERQHAFTLAMMSLLRSFFGKSAPATDFTESTEELLAFLEAPA